MPGFQITASGGKGPRNTVETRRNHRWLWEVLGDVSTDVLILLQKAQRPKFVNEEPELHHNQEKAYFIGKQGWEPITMSFYDAEQNPNSAKAIWEWLNVGNIIPSANVSPPLQYKKEGSLQMIDGMGVPTETWRIHGCWPKEVGYSDLDYTNTEIALVEVTLRYDRAERTA